MLVKKIVEQGENYTFEQINSDKSGFKVKLAQRMGLPKEYYSNLIVGNTDLKGNVVVTLTPDAKDGFKHDVMMKNLLADGATEKC